MNDYFAGCASQGRPQGCFQYPLPVVDLYRECNIKQAYLLIIVFLVIAVLRFPLFDAQRDDLGLLIIFPLAP